MSRRSVNIDRIELRLRGVSPQAARAAAQGLARELLEELGRDGAGEPPRGGGRAHLSVERVEARVPSAEAVAPGGGLRATLARRVADAVRARIK